VTLTEKREVDTVAEFLGASASDYLMHLHRRAMKDLKRKKERHSHRQPEEGHLRARREPEEPDASQEPRNREDAQPSVSHRVKPRKRHRRDEDDGLAGVGARL
jgi:hypothetical protein